MGNTIRSNVAEILWWLEPSDTKRNGAWDWDPSTGLKETCVLRRRVLLVLPDQTNLPAGVSPKQFHMGNDLSVRLENGRLFANSLADLTKRQKPCRPRFRIGNRARSQQFPLSHRTRHGSRKPGDQTPNP